MKRVGALLVLVFCPLALVHAQEASPSLHVNGRGEVAVAPDRAVVIFGAVARAKEAAAAQDQVNRVINDAVRAVLRLGIPESALTTTGLTLTPVYSEVSAREPRVNGFEADNRLEVRLADVGRLGATIDAAIGAGANRIEGITLTLHDDRAVRSEALRLAVREARGKAETMAAAMGVRLVGVAEVMEQGGGVIAPRMRGGAMAMASELATPVLSGQVQIEAHVSVRYRIAPLK